MDDDFVLEWDGKEIPSLDDELSEEELKKMDEDAFLDGKPGTIPNWAKHCKSDK